MTTIIANVPKKNMSNWLRAGTAVTATSASDVASQAGLDWSVSLHDLSASYQIPGGEAPVNVPINNKFGVIKTTPFGDVTGIGVVGGRYQVFQNSEIFSALDGLIDSGEARYAAAGEYDGGAKVWMLLQIPEEIVIGDDPHAAFILAKTSHDGSSSVVIKPIIERLWCANQINKIYNGKNAYTYTLKHTLGNQLKPADISNILKLSYDNIETYKNVAGRLITRQTSRENALEYFKKVFPLPAQVENTHPALLTAGEKRQLSRAQIARATALNIYENSPTQANIRNTAFGLWQSVIEYTDHNGKRNAAERAIKGASDAIKVRALELLEV